MNTKFTPSYIKTHEQRLNEFFEWIERNYGSGKMQQVSDILNRDDDVIFDFMGNDINQELIEG